MITGNIITDFCLLILFLPVVAFAINIFIGIMTIVTIRFQQSTYFMFTHCAAVFLFAFLFREGEQTMRY